MMQSNAGGKSSRAEEQTAMTNTNYKLILIAVLAATVGFAAATAIHARQMKTPAGYIISEVEVNDPATFQKYADKVPETLAPFKGHFLVRGGKAVALEGDAPKRIVVIAFESLEQARNFENSAAYSAIRPIRISSTKSRVLMVEGTPPQ
jgi:uncharacterized protein (DUF1330 family)